MATEKRLIDANKLFDDVENSKYDNPHTNGRVRINHIQEHDHFMKMIFDAPTVDAVEVVRCKDCKHGIWAEDEQMWECILGVDLTGDADTYAMFHEYNHGDHFCSYGERRTDG